MQPHQAEGRIRPTWTTDNCQDATPGTELPLNLTMKELTLSFFNFVSVCDSLTAPSPVTMIKKEKTSRNSVSLSWQQPERPNGIILDYEIKYYEKVGAGFLMLAPEQGTIINCVSWRYNSQARLGWARHGIKYSQSLLLLDYLNFIGSNERSLDTT